MIDWILENKLNILIVGVLVLVITLVIVSLVRDRKKGKHICSGDCGSCGGCPSSEKVLFKITLGIDGMHCAMCECTVNDILRNSFGAKKVSSDAKKNRSVMILSKIPKREEIERALSEKGYILSSIDVSLLQ